MWKMTAPDHLNPLEHPWLAAQGPKAIWAAVKAAGGEARVVGGAVRDALLGLPVEDIDFACTLPPEAVTQALEKAGIKVVPTGIDHGTVTAVVAGRGYEITTLRHDVETTGRHAKVAFTDDWQADAQRRDFTFNALYVDEAGQIYDFTNGRADLAAGCLRFIGDPEARIQEDVLRILRFFRFLAQMTQDEGGSFTPDAKALTACKELAPLLSTLSAERVWKEISRLLCAADPLPSLRLMVKSDVLSHILPEAVSLDKLTHLVSVEKSHNQQTHAVRRLAALVEDDGEAIARRLRLSRAETAALLWCRNIPMAFHVADEPRSRSVLLYDYGKEPVRDAVLLLMAEGRIEKGELFLAQLETWEKPVFPILGKDLLALGLKPGPRVGRVLSHVEQWWIDKEFAPTHAECLAMAKAVLQSEEKN